MAQRPAKIVRKRTAAADAATDWLKRSKVVSAPPPAKRGRVGGSKWDSLVEWCNDNPGQWREITNVPVSNSTTLKKRGLEVTTRDADSKTGIGTIYVRFNPE